MSDATDYIKKEIDGTPYYVDRSYNVEMPSSEGDDCMVNTEMPKYRFTIRFGKSMPRHSKLIQVIQCNWQYIYRRISEKNFEEVRIQFEATIRGKTEVAGCKITAGKDAQHLDIKPSWGRMMNDILVKDEDSKDCS